MSFPSSLAINPSNTDYSTTSSAAIGGTIDNSGWTVATSGSRASSEMSDMMKYALIGAVALAVIVWFSRKK